MSEEHIEEQIAVTSTWSGFFTFTNQLGQAITSGTAKHWTTDYRTESIDLTRLGVGQTSSAKVFTTSTTNKDRWTFTATVADGTTHIIGEKDCRFETKDSGKTVNLQAIVNSGTKSFYIAIPSSSDCSTTF
jgi:hypothetical protein